MLVPGGYTYSYYTQSEENNHSPSPLFFPRFCFSSFCFRPKCKHTTFPLSVKPARCNKCSNKTRTWTPKSPSWSRSEVCDRSLWKPERVEFRHRWTTVFFFRFSECLVVSVSGCFFFGGGEAKIWSFIFFWGAEKLGSEFAGVECVKLLKTGGNFGFVDFFLGIGVKNLVVENFHPKNVIFSRRSTTITRKFQNLDCCLVVVLWMEPLKERRASRCTTTCVLEIGHILIFFYNKDIREHGLCFTKCFECFLWLYGCLIECFIDSNGSCFAILN